MSDTTTQQTQPRPSPGPVPKRRWRPRRLHLHLSIWSLISIGLVAAFLVLASMSLTGRVIALPNWVAERVEDRLNATGAMLNFSLRKVEFGVTPAGRPKLRVVDLRVRDQTGLELAQLNGVEGGFRLGPALFGKIEPTLLRLQGAQMTLRRLTDGSFALSLGQEVGTAGDLASVLDSIDAAFTTGPLATSHRVEATDLTLTLEDARSGRIWQVTDGRLEIVPGERVIDTIVRFDVFNQTEELATTEVSFRSARDSSEASLAARFENAAARDIAAQSPALAFLSVFDAPISGALRTTVGEDGAISELVGFMQIGEGALSPEPGAQPAKFDGAKIYIDYDPIRQRIDFQGASVESELGTAQAEGHVYLTEFRGGWPNSLIGQVAMTGAELDPGGFFEAPLKIDNGRADLRVRLDPFSIDIGQAVMFRDDRRYVATGKVSAEPDGWRVAIDGTFDEADLAEALALWPVTVAAEARAWTAEYALDGVAFDGILSFRKAPTEYMEFSTNMGVRNAKVLALPDWPAIDLDLGYVTVAPNSVTVTAEDATITAPDGNTLDLAGVSYRIPDFTDAHSTSTVNVAVDGPLRGVLSLLDREPFSIFAASGFGPDMARGQAEVRGLVTFSFTDGDVLMEDVRYDIRADLTGVTSDVIVEEKLLVGDQLSVVATEAGIEVSGPVRLGQADILGAWRLPLLDGKAGASSVEGTIAINQRSLSEFGISGLEDMISGEARGRFTLSFPDNGPIALDLKSDLGGLAMDIPGTGWTKSTAATGTLEVRARLGDRPVVDELILDAPGLNASGVVTTTEGGGLGEARFDRVRIGGWLDAPVVLTGRGPNVPMAVAIPGGTIDMREAQLDTGGGGGGAAGPRRPLTLALDRLIVSEGIRFDNLRADLDFSGGLHGTFTGEVAGAPIRGTMAQSTEGAAFRITSSDAGAVLRGAGVFSTARGGDLELILAPVQGAGTYEGEFTIEDTRVVNSGAMTELLAAVSIVGLLEQIEEEGIRFGDVEGRFRLDPTAVTLYRSSAIGASMGISLDGYYDLAAGQIDMQGVLSPLYILNVIGRIFSARDGEGLVGFNFNLTGDVSDPEIDINPLSILTPGVFREIFRRPPPEAPSEE